MKQSTLADIPLEADIATRSTRSATACAARIALLLLTTASCGFPRPPDLVGDAVGGSDGPAGPIVAVHVSPSGDDVNDGLMLPVKTLKRAIALAGANAQITQIALATGTYSASSGETFPYIVPPNVIILGPASGGAIIAGSKAEPGVTVDVGGLQDLEFQDFTTAITVTGTASLKNIHVLTSTIAVQAESTASLTVNSLDITNNSNNPCLSGIVLNGAAKLVAMTLMTNGLGITLDARDQSVAAVANATISGNPACAVATMSVMSTAAFSLSDSLLDGGSSGIGIVAQSTSFHATLSNTRIKNMKNDGLGGFPNVKASFQMTGGELSSNGASGAELGQGTWIFTNVAIRQNKNLAFYLQDANLVMRNSMVVDNGFGIDVYSGSVADLGTATNPGGNVFQGNSGVGVFAESSVPVSAIGNTWNPNVQGADANGRYPVPATISGPVSANNNTNFGINDGCSLSR